MHFPTGITGKGTLYKPEEKYYGFKANEMILICTEM